MHSVLSVPLYVYTHTQRVYLERVGNGVNKLRIHLAELFVSVIVRSSTRLSV